MNSPSRRAWKSDPVLANTVPGKVADLTDYMKAI